MLCTSNVLKSSTLHCTGHRFASMAATGTQSLNPLPLQPFLEHKQLVSEFLTYLLRCEVTYFRGFYSICIMKTSPSKILIFFVLFCFSEPCILAEQGKGTPSSPCQPYFLQNKAEWKTVIGLISAHSTLNGHKTMRAHRCPSTHLYLFNLPGKLCEQHRNTPESWPQQHYWSGICSCSI